MTRLSTDVAAAMGRHAVVVASGLLMVPLIARRLGADRLGAWALISATIFLLGMSDLGLSTAVHRAAAAKDDPGRAHRVVGLTVLVILVVAPVVALAAYPLLLDLPGAQASLLADMERALLLALPAGVIDALACPFRGFAMVRGGIAGLAMARLCGSVTQVFVTALGLALAPTLLAPAAGLLVSAVVETALTARVARAIDPALPLRPRAPASRRELFDPLRDGAATLSLNLVLMAGSRADILILSRVGSLSTVAAYSVASRAVDQAYLLAKQTSTAMFPRLGDAHARAHAVRLGTGLLGAFVWSGMIALVTQGQPLLVAWAGPAAAGPVAARAIVLLGLAAALCSTYEIAVTALTLGGRTAWEGAVPIMAGCLVNVALSVAGAARFGVFAVAGGTLVGNAITCALTWSRARRLLGWPGHAVGAALSPALLAGAASLASGVALARMVPATTAGAAAACVASTAIGCSAAALLMAWRLSPAASAG